MTDDGTTTAGGERVAGFGTGGHDAVVGRTQRVRAALRRDRARVVGEIRRLGAESAEHLERVGARQPCAYGSPAVVEEEQRHARRIASVQRRERALREIDDALRRLEEDPEAFGHCETCGRAIAEERLALLPHTRTCAACAD